jgi:hypothetical protein
MIFPTRRLFRNRQRGPQVSLSTSSFVLAFVVPSLLCTALAQAQASNEYQTAKIVAVEQIFSPDNITSGTDAPMTSNVSEFNLSVELGEQAYLCRVRTASDFDLNWANGREVQARTQGKVMYVKRANGKVLRLSIVGIKKPH